MDRKGMKVAAKKTQRKHYWIIVVICLFASVFGVAYTSSTLSVNISPVVLSSGRQFHVVAYCAIICDAAFRAEFR